MCTDLCEVIITTVHVVLCVVVKNALLLEYRHALFASYIEILWIAAVVLEMVLGLFSIVWAIAKYVESKKYNRITHTLEFVMGLLHLTLQARIVYILQCTDLCESTEMDKKVEGDSIWITTFILVLLDNVYRYFLLTVRCININTTDKNDFCKWIEKDDWCTVIIKILLSWCLYLTLYISGSNIYISLNNECKVF